MRSLTRFSLRGLLKICGNDTLEASGSSNILFFFLMAGRIYQYITEKVNTQIFLNNGGGKIKSLTKAICVGGAFLVRSWEKPPPKKRNLATSQSILESFFFAGGRVLTSFNNEFSHCIRPIAVHWNRVSYDVHQQINFCRTAGEARPCHTHLHCGEVTGNFCRSSASRCSAERIWWSPACRRLRYECPAKRIKTASNGSYDWLCIVGKLSGTPYIAACGG